MFDVVVIGGGPAGTTAAGLLARWGHEVALVTRERARTGWLPESIPASARPLLGRAGTLEAVEAAGFFPNGGNTVRWAAGPERTEPFAAGEEGFHAERARLEAALLPAVAAVGVRVRRDAPVRDVARLEAGWRLDRGAAALRSRWVLDASGRAGVMARRGLRVPERDPVTLALVGRWRRGTPWEGGDVTHTWIESYQDGWAWSIPLAGGLRCVTAMVDPRRSDMLRGRDLDAVLAAEVAKTERLRVRLEGAAPLGPARACLASLYAARRYAGPRFLLVGDAGSFIDPLSSYGVKKALASGWLAAVAVNTALRDPGRTEMAIGFFERRERDVYRTYRARSIPFFEEAAAAHGHAFWRARARAARAAAGAGREDEPSDWEPSRDADGLTGLPAVRAAFEAIRARPSLCLRPGRGVRPVALPIVVGNEIRLEPHLATPAVPGGVRFVRNVDLARLVALAPGRESVPELYDAYNAQRPPAALPDLLAALAVAVGTGLLELPASPASSEALAPASVEAAAPAGREGARLPGAGTGRDAP